MERSRSMLGSRQMSALHWLAAWKCCCYRFVRCGRVIVRITCDERGASRECESACYPGGEGIRGRMW